MEKKLSLKKKLILELALVLVLIAIIFVSFSYYFQKSVFLESYKSLGKSHAIYYQENSKSVAEAMKRVIESSEKGEEIPSDSNILRLEENMNPLPDSSSVVQQTYLIDAVNFSKESGKTRLVIGNQSFYKEGGVKRGFLYESDSIMGNALWEVIQTGQIVTTSVYEDQFGEWISIFFPIKDEEEKVIAIWGMDLGTKQMNASLFEFILEIGILGFISVILIGIVLFYRLNLVFNPLSKLSKIAEEISSGNLYVELEYNRKDEIQTIYLAIGKMLDRLKGLILRMNKAGSQMSEVGHNILQNSSETIENSRGISDSVTELNEVILEQATSIEESKAAVEEVTMALHRISTVAANVNVSASNSFEAAGRGEIQIKNLLTDLKKIQKSVSESGNVVDSLNRGSKEIGKIIESITNIASQTNLLALNASIEAARAGEQGKGFAVVADEVSKLAEKSTASAKQIQSMIEDIQNNIHELVSSMESTDETMKSGSRSIEAVEKDFLEIVESAKSVSVEISDVSASVEEISASSDEVISAMDQNMDKSKQAMNSAKTVLESIEMQRIAIHQIESKAKSLGSLSKDFEKIITSI